MNTEGFFITGTDTDVGKTIVSAIALSLARARGLDAVPMKPVQTGAALVDGKWRSPDLDFCLKTSGLAPGPDEYRLMSRYRLETPASPHLAAADAGVQIDIAAIAADAAELGRAHEFLVVEGAGGLFAPLDERRFMLDLMCELGFPVILVSRSGLGTINHTLLSLRELQRAGMAVAGVVFNDTRPQQAGRIERDNLSVIERLGETIAPVYIPYLENIDVVAGSAPDFAVAASCFRDGFEKLMRSCGSPPACPAQDRRDMMRSPPACPAGAENFAHRQSSARHVALPPAAGDGPEASALWHPYTRRSTQRAGNMPMIARADGVFLYDAAGRRYFDAISSWWACNLGHGHPRLLRAMREQSEKLQHSILGGMSHPRAEELASRLAAMFKGGRRVMFASDGACAVEAAMKIALQYRHNTGDPKRGLFASLSDAYHGDTLGAVSAGYIEAFHKPFAPVLPRALRVEAPACHACPWGGSLRQCGLECFQAMRETIERNAAELTAVIIEPLCRGAAGMRIYPARYLLELAGCCRAHGALLIVDEIAMGFGRTGRMFAHEHAGIEPDIVCVGKALSGGYLPISAAIVKDSIYETFDDRERDNTFYHGHTFCGNPVAAAVALEALKIYSEENIPAAAVAMQALFERDSARFAGMPGVRNVRCLGAIWAVEFGPDETMGAKRASALAARMRERGVLLRPLGPVLYFTPPLVTSPDTLAWALDELARTAAETVP